MSPKLFVVFFTALSFSVIWLTTRKENNKQKPSTQNQITQNQEKTKGSDFILETNRFKIRDRLFKDAQDVADVSGVQEAKEIVKFLKENSIISEPTPEGVRILESAQGPTWFHFIPLIVGDDTKGELWESFYSSHGSMGVANFLPDSRGMIIKSHLPMSHLWTGIILIHEGRHAREFLTRKYNWKEGKIYCTEERDTHELQNQIMQKFGGEKYRTFVQKLAEEIEIILKAQGYRPGEAVISRTRNYPELNEIFTPALSELERDFRETSVWIHANFLAIEKTYGAQAPEQKILFLNTLYLKKGLILR